jgi:hypothetical protein
MSNTILTDKEIKRKASPFVVNLCATLAVLSIFVNSIGLNLMQINGAVTDYIITAINNTKPVADNKTNNDIKALQSIAVYQQKQITALQKDSHSPIKKQKS